MMLLRTSERGTFKRCPQRWEWSVKEGLEPRRTANPLWWGQAMHIALAEWYLKGFKRGPHPAETFAKVLDGDRSIRVPSDSGEVESEYVDARQLGIDVLKHYVEHYGRDSGWDVIVTEQQFRYVIPRLGLKRGRHIEYVGTFDGAYRDVETGQIYLMEHKSAAGINLEHLPLDQQASSYWLVVEYVLRKMGLIQPGEHVVGIMYNFVRKSAPDNRPRNAEGAYTNKPQKAHFHEAFKEHGVPWARWGELKLEELHKLARELRIPVLGEVSKTQPAPYFIREPVFRMPEERRRQLESIQRDAWHIEQAMINPNYPIMKNPTKDCSWDCAFFQMCQLHEAGDLESVEDFKAALYKKRDPYDVYRKSVS